MTDSPSPLQGRTIAFLVANEGVEEVELTEPWHAVERAGGRPVLLAPQRPNLASWINDHLEGSPPLKSARQTLPPVSPTTRRSI